MLSGLLLVPHYPLKKYLLLGLVFKTAMSKENNGETMKATRIIFLLAVFLYVELRSSRTHFKPHVDPPTISAPPIAGWNFTSLLKSETVDRTYRVDAVVSV